MEVETSGLGDVEGMETESVYGWFQLHCLDSSEGQQCTLLQAPRTVQNMQSNASDTFNLLMADVSGSMSLSWPYVVEGWNASIEKQLYGVTKLYTFDERVKFLRVGTVLTQEDFTGGGTNITRALKKVNEEVEGCQQSFVQVFIITDGGHGSGAPYPEEEINRMKAPPGKTVNVYLLGITTCFPVNYSIDIRSHLHNGSANLPSLYWAKEETDIVEQMEAIGFDISSGHVKMTLNQEGYILPGLPSTHTIHPGEWVYFPKPPEDVVGLKVSINDEEEREVPQLVKQADIITLLDHLFPQWNSVLIQQHRQKQYVPKETFNLMDTLFHTNIEKMKKAFDDAKEGIRSRLERKKLRDAEVKYTTLMNMSRTVIEVEGRYENEMELANNILKSTVSGRKYDTRILKMRGHGLDDYDRDRRAFFHKYREVRESIKALPTPHPDECCSIIMSSTLSDLLDEDFLLMEEEGKYDLLRTFTMSGIPAYAPVRDASQINAWTLGIRHILVMPFAVLSQRSIEAYAGVEGPDNVLGFIDKDVLLKADDDKTRFNIIIPTVPAYAAEVLKPLVRSNLYAMLATFCILKNPHIIDHSAHLAALACAWVKSVADHPPASRPEYVSNRLATIVATSEIYMDRKSVVTYLKALTDTPKQALMTESTETFDKLTLKCESLVKPLFFLGMRKNQVTMSQVTAILHLLLAEYIGRCLSGYKVAETNATPFTDFFAPELNDPKNKDEWLTKESQVMVDDFRSTCGNLLKEFYGPEDVQKATQKYINHKIAALGSHLTNTVTLAVNMEKVKHLKNVGSCGDIRFHTFRAWAQEMGVPEEEITAAYDPSQVFVYVCEALHFRNSRERLNRNPNSYAECLEQVKTQVSKENGKSLLEVLVEKIGETALNDWKEEYLAVHEHIVMPLTPQEVVTQARARGIEVTEETFSQVYRYDVQCRLVRNACMVPACPFYLVPNRKFNQHLAAERAFGKFPHSLHLVSKELCGEEVEKVMEEVCSGQHSGRQGRKKCPVSNLFSLQKLKPEIQELLHVYKETPIPTVVK